MISSVNKKGKDQEGIIFTSDLRSGISAVEKQLLNSDMTTENALAIVNKVTATAMLVAEHKILWQARLNGNKVDITAWKVIKVVDGEYRLKSKDGKYCRILPSKINTAGYNMAWSTSQEQAVKLLLDYCQRKSVNGRSIAYSRDNFKKISYLLNRFLSEYDGLPGITPYCNGILKEEIRIVA